MKIFGELKKCTIVSTGLKICRVFFAFIVAHNAKIFLSTWYAKWMTIASAQVHFIYQHLHNSVFKYGILYSLVMNIKQFTIFFLLCFAPNFLPAMQMKIEGYKCFDVYFVPFTKRRAQKLSQFDHFV